MAQIALKKPSGGELIITPEDGTSTETVTIPSVGVGKVLQVVHATQESEVVIASDTFSNVMTAQITPLSSSSKILIRVDAQANRNGADNGYGIQILADGVVIATSGSGYVAYDASSAGSRMSSTFQEYHSPNTTSTITYTFQARCHVAARGQMEFSDDGVGECYITLMEVAA